MAASDASVKKHYVVGVDIGTTTLRSHVYDQNGSILGSSSKRIELLHPKPGWVEMDPEVVVKQTIEAMEDSIRASSLKPKDITCMGLATQRASFITWDRETGKPFHNIVSWQDLRAADYVADWNRSFTMKALNTGSRFVHIFTRSKRHLAASVLRFMSKQVTMRLLWLLDNIKELRARALAGQVCFGCIDTWLLWKLTGGQVHATDYSCASSTGLYDPFQMEWSTIVCNLLSIPMTIFPEVRDTSGSFGQVDPAYFGVAIPITAVVADQQGAMFGQCCFSKGDVKCTMGTGTFVDINTGDKPHASIAGLYPLIGWKIGDEITFLAEGLAADTGAMLEWAKSVKWIDDIMETAKLASSVKDSGGVCFVPAFSGLQAPINDDKAATTVIGLTPSTTQAHVVRAILESLAFRFKMLYETILTETRIPLSCIRADGGVCNNDFVMQLMADLVNQTIERAAHTDMTSLGAAFLAGLAAGVWKSKEELTKLHKCERVFTPETSWTSYRETFHQWERAVSRSRSWVTDS